MDRLLNIARRLARTTGLFGPARSLYRSLLNPAVRERRKLLWKRYRGIIRPGTLVFDVGADIGLYSEVFASLGARVVAVEPLPENVRVLQNCAHRDRIEVVQAAAGPAVGTATFHTASLHTMGSLSAEWLEAAARSPRVQAMDVVWSGEIEVPTTTLDLLAGRFGYPDFIKIDVEGYEEGVLQGLSRQPRCMSFEFNPEIFDVAQRCLHMPLFDSASEFNYVVLESGDFALPAWTSRESLLDHLRRAHIEASGDIFVRRPGPPA
ncbi:MAG TPA: FkbM family methyltransferase [Candidatus Acidoferrales bacterium]|nr:FkbM family methyltransferase [Candidatus Acidoferrales bacterium]